MDNYHSMDTTSKSILQMARFNYVSISYILHYVCLPKQTTCKLVLQERSVIINNIIKSLSIANFLL